MSPEHSSGRFAGRVVLVTGGARGQGRSHAIAFAREGADIVICDVPGQISTVSYAMASAEDLRENQTLVEAEGRRCIAVAADVRDRAAIDAMVARAIDELGKIDILLANAGIVTYGPLVEQTHETWDDVIGTVLTGVWNSMKAVVPHMLERRYGRIVVTTSSVARQPQPNVAPYLAGKSGVIGLVKGLAREVIKDGLTVNAVAPYLVATPIIFNDPTYAMFLPELDHPTRADAERLWREISPNGQPYLQPQDITDAMLFLASDAASKISGICLDVQGGWNAGTPV